MVSACILDVLILRLRASISVVLIKASYNLGLCLWE
jgi:hypothetical protein